MLAEPGTGTAVLLAALKAVVVLLFLSLVTYGFALLAVLLFPFIEYYQRKRAMALIHGSGVRLWRHQLPQVYDCVATFARRVGLAEPPEVYLVEDSIQNAAAVRHGNRGVILLTDEIVDACLRSGDPRSLAFVLAHEVAHVALGHLKPTRGYLRQMSKPLSRLDELSADRVALELVGARDVAALGIMVLTTGPALLRFIDQRVVAQQAAEVASDRYTKKAEKKLTHPLLLRRLARVLGGGGAAAAGAR
jgi:Zn-dependent protease with chaperone function